MTRDWLSGLLAAAGLVFFFGRVHSDANPPSPKWVDVILCANHHPHFSWLVRGGCSAYDSNTQMLADYEKCQKIMLRGKVDPSLGINLMRKHRKNSTLSKEVALKVCFSVAHFYATKSAMTHHFNVNTDLLVQNEARTRPEMKSWPIFGQKQCSNQLFVIISRLKIFTHINFASVLNAIIMCVGFRLVY